MPRFGWFFGMIFRVSLISHVDIRCPLHGGNECNTATYWTVPPSSCTCSCCVCGNSCCRASTYVRRDYSVACWLCHVCGRSQALPPVGPDSRPVYNQTYSVTEPSQVLTTDQSTTKHTVSQRLHRSWQPTSLQPNIQCHRAFTGPDSRPVYNQTYSVTETSQVLTADQSTTKHTVSQRLHRSWQPTSLQPNIQCHREFTSPDSRPVYNQTYSVTETSQVLTADQSTTKHTVSQRLHRSWQPTSLQPNIQCHRDFTGPDSRSVYNQTYSVTETSQILTADQSTTKHTVSQRFTDPDSRPVYNQTYSVTEIYRSWQPTSLQPNIQSHRDVTDPDSRPVYNQTYSVTETFQVLTADQSTTKHTVSQRFTDPNSRPVYNQTYSVTGTSQILTADQSTTKHTVSQRLHRSWQPISLQPNIQCHRDLQILTADQSTTKHTVSQRRHRSWQPISLQPNIQCHRDLQILTADQSTTKHSVTGTSQILTAYQSTTKHTVSQRLHRSWQPISLQPNIQCHRDLQILTADQSTTKHTVSQRFTDPDSRPVYNQTYRVTETSLILTADQSTTKHTVSQRLFRSWQSTSLHNKNSFTQTYGSNNSPYRTIIRVSDSAVQS